jgi:rhamnulokinase
VSEVHRFQNSPIQEKGSAHWDMAKLYEETLSGLREVGRYDEPVNGISCSSWAADYMLFEPGGALLSPTFHGSDTRAQAGMREVFSKVPLETIYEETGVQPMPANTLFQLGVEKSKRLKRGNQLMPVADGFNYLLAGVPSVEMSLASATQLFNPVTQTWSERLLKSLRLPPELFPPVVAAGTKLGALRSDIAKATKLDEVEVVSSCSHELAAALAGLPVTFGERWAFLQMGHWATMGTELSEPIINEVSRDMNFTNEVGYGGSIRFSKRVPALWILDECRRHWKQTDRELDNDVLAHLAVSAPPFESLINPDDPRFTTPGDMPLKIQAFCKETKQEIPRKPGAVARCVLESLALQYRKVLREMEYLTGREIKRLYLLGNSGNTLLNNFTANALQIPMVIAPADATAIGNVIVQAMALGHIQSHSDARDVVRNSFKMETVIPHAEIWKSAYDRFEELVPA